MARLSNKELEQRLQRVGLKQLLETSSVFRKFVLAIFTEASVFYPTYQRGSPHGSTHAEGRRSLGLEVLHMLKHAEPSVLSLIEREGNLLAEELGAAQPPGASDEPEDLTDDDDESDLRP